MNGEKKPFNMKKGGLIWSIWNFIEAALLSSREFFRTPDSLDSVIGGTIELAFGVALCVSMTGNNPTAIIEVIMNFIVWLVSILLMAAGVSLIAFAIGFIVSKLYKVYMPVIEIILGALLIGTGVTIIVLFTNNSEIVMSIMLVIVGLALAVASVFKIISVVKAIIKVKEEKEPDENVFDAETNEIKEEPVQESESTEVVIVSEENE